MKPGPIVLGGYRGLGLDVADVETANVVGKKRADEEGFEIVAEEVYVADNVVEKVRPSVFKVETIVLISVSAYVLVAETGMFSIMSVSTTVVTRLVALGTISVALV